MKKLKFKLKYIELKYWWDYILLFSTDIRLKWLIWDVLTKNCYTQFFHLNEIIELLKSWKAKQELLSDKVNYAFWLISQDTCH